MGDINDILNNRDKFGGKNLDRRRSFLGEFIQSVGAIDLSFMRKMFTWENRQVGNAYIKEKSDRCLVHKKWLSMFSDATVQHLMAEVSDHILILLDTAGSRRFSKRPFRYLEAWTSNERSWEVVKMAWDQYIRGEMESHRI